MLYPEIMLLDMMCVLRVECHISRLLVRVDNIQLLTWGVLGICSHPEDRDPS